ncbi:COX15/CtaA family protein [Cryptosporangium phraense]|uniref:Heme A synthase n=1 Tax=Cryptosporangium phraense TaxID=2593070 RepID=A0A545AKH1_9ACTN|nr:COX15/CtaA family protein [Cryptosporangium phraense]TQS41245.1 heme A synthase [Cryptosporangium phraense]
MSTATAAATEPAAPDRDPTWFQRLRNAPSLVRWLAFGTVVGNIVIVLTGAAVRLSASGLGCPTWPKCTDDSYTNTPEFGIHGYIEFGNRLLTFVLSAIVAAAIITVFLQRPRRRSLVWLSLAQFFGIVAQAVVGGITVLTGLNPWTVSAHFLVSMALIYAAYAFWVRTGEGDGPRDWRVTAPLRWVGRGIAVAAGATIVIGTVVTGSGPHSGDGNAPRTGFDPALVSQLHADAVFLLIGLTIGGVLALRGVPAARNAVIALLVVELAQGLIGYVQYFTHLPVGLVAAHVLGASILWAFALHVLFSLRVRNDRLTA